MDARMSKRRYPVSFMKVLINATQLYQQ